MKPAFALSLPGTPTSAFGLPRLTWLKTFCASTRSSRLVRPLKLNRLNSDASTFQKPGPRSSLRSMSPKVPRAGRPKALPDEPMGVTLK